MLDIKQIALEVAKKHWFAIVRQPTSPTEVEIYPAPHSEQAIVDFATRFLAAITAKAEPVARFDVTASGHYALVFKNQLVKEENLKPGAKFYTHPAIEPAPLEPYQIQVEGTVGNDAVGAAPLPDEVREIVERLRAYPTRDGLLAAEMIERLARQVPPDCVWTQDDDEAMPGTWDGACGAKWSFIDGGPKENDLNFCPQCGAHVVISAGEVKP